MRARASVLLAASLASAPALAWDPAFHHAIFQAARRLSPVVDARIGDQYRDALRSGLEEADPLDRSCLTHRAPDARGGPWDQAQKLLEGLRNPNPKWSARTRTQMLGQYFHYVADSAVPRDALDRRAYALSGDVVVYREKRPLVEPLAGSLRQRGAEAVFTDGRTESEAFRAVVNLMVDAAVLLPERPGTAPTEDRGPVILVPLSKVTHSNNAESLRILHAGIHVLEWTARETREGSVVRALIYNNVDFCVRHLLFWSDSWVGGLTTSLPPQTLKVVELPGPPRLASDVIVRFIPGDCARENEPAVMSLGWRMVASTTIGVPRFEEGGVKEYRPGDPVPTLPGTTYLEYLKSDLEAIGGLQILSFQATARNGRVDFHLRIKNASETKPKPFNLELQVGSLETGVSEWKEMSFDVSKLAAGSEKTFDGYIPARTYGESTGIRVYRIRRGPPGRPVKF